jgi:hypothetical protein
VILDQALGPALGFLRGGSAEERFAAATLLGSIAEGRRGAASYLVAEGALPAAAEMLVSGAGAWGVGGGGGSAGGAAAEACRARRLGQERVSPCLEPCGLRAHLVRKAPRAAPATPRPPPKATPRRATWPRTWCGTWCAATASCCPPAAARWAWRGPSWWSRCSTWWSG